MTVVGCYPAAGREYKQYNTKDGYEYTDIKHSCFAECELGMWLAQC